MTDQAQYNEDAAAIRAAMSGVGAKRVDKKDKILERVRAILALAEDEQLRNPAAADNYREQADNLMRAYALEQWQVELKREGTMVRPEPEIRYLNFDWWYRSQFSSDLHSMFYEVARHCRVVIALRGHGTNGNYHSMPVVGLPSDIDYFDMLFTHLMLQMVRQLEPKPEPGLSFGENAYRMRMGGMNRLRTCELLWNSEVGIPDIDTNQPFDNEYSSITKKALRTIRRYAEEYAKANGFETTKISTATWQRSFSRGFVEEISMRLWRMKRAQEEQSGGGDSSTALALRDIYSVAMELYKKEWPPPPPVKVDSTEVVKTRKVRSRAISLPKYDSRGMSAGREAGRKANLSNKPSDRIGGRKGLPKEI